MNTRITEMLNVRLPIFAAPMFLVSNEDLVVAASEAGGVGFFPSLNYRPASEFKKVLQSMKSKTKSPIGVNIIVNKSNLRQSEDLKIALDLGVECFITSLGSPKEVIQEAKRTGARVFCDVINVEQALKVQELGADGVIAVSSGAGGHAGAISPLVLIPWLKSQLSIPIIAAGGIAHGSQISACLALGAEGVSVGTRFIASHEANVDSQYKEAILRASPEDIVMTTRISGTPASVIQTEYIKKTGLELSPVLKYLKNQKLTKKYIVPIIHALGSRTLEASAKKASWKSVWSAGQSVGMIDDILWTREIFQKLVAEIELSHQELQKKLT